MLLSPSSLATPLIYQRLTSGDQHDLLPDLGELDVTVLIRTMRIISELEFQWFELYLDTEENLSILLQEENLGRVRQACKDLNLRIERAHYKFLAARIFGPESGLLEKTWSKIAAISNALGITMIEMVSSTIPTSTLLSVRDENNRQPPNPASDLSWDELWKKYVSAMKVYAKFAERCKLRLALEPRPREILSTTDSVLRLLDFVPSENLGGVIDIGRLHILRETPAVSIRKLGRNLFGVHLSDNDGVTESHWAPGHGEIDWPPVFEALDHVGYKGVLSLDVLGIDVRSELFEGKHYIEQMRATKIKNP
jgi:sugar phosphate isomerase/epimerase